jgi:hypothetical protein
MLVWRPKGKKYVGFAGISQLLWVLRRLMAGIGFPAFRLTGKSRYCTSFPEGKNVPYFTQNFQAEKDFRTTFVSCVYS